MMLTIKSFIFFNIAFLFSIKLFIFYMLTINILIILKNNNLNQYLFV